MQCGEVEGKAVHESLVAKLGDVPYLCEFEHSECMSDEVHYNHVDNECMMQDLPFVIAQGVAQAKAQSFVCVQEDHYFEMCNCASAGGSAQGHGVNQEAVSCHW